MQKTNAEILSHFYSLLLELNFHESEEEEIKHADVEDAFLKKHLRVIKLKMAQNKVELKKRRFQALLMEIDRLRTVGVDELRKLLTPKEAMQLQPLFSKFESLSDRDRESIAEDEELLQIICSLKERLEKPNLDE